MKCLWCNNEAANTSVLCWECFQNKYDKKENK